MNKTVEQIKKEIEEAEAKMNQLAAPSEYPSYAVRKENGYRGKDGKPMYDENEKTWDDHRQTVLKLRRELEDAQRQQMTDTEINRVDYFNQAAEDYENE